MKTTNRLSTRMLLMIGVFFASFQAVKSLPASLAPAIAGFERGGVRYETARGVIWDGVLTGVEVSGVKLNEVRFKLSPLGLFTGRLEGTFSMAGGALIGDGYASLRPGGHFILRDARLAFDLDAANRYAFLGEPLQGFVSANVGRFAASRSGCELSETQLSTNVLAAPARRLGGEAFDLAGTGVCEDGDFLISLAGKGDDGAVTMSIRITPTMDYTLAATAQPANSEVAAALQYLGFQEENGALKIDTNGVIRSVGS